MTITMPNTLAEEREYLRQRMNYIIANPKSEVTRQDIMETEARIKGLEK